MPVITLRHNAVAILLAVVSGAVIVTQPPLLVAGFMAGLLLLALAAYSPLIPLSLMLVLAPLRTLIATESSFQLPLDIGLLLLVVVMCAWLLDSSVKKRQLLPSKIDPIYVPLILVIVIFGFNIVAARSVAFWVNEWLKWVIMLGLMLFVIQNMSLTRWKWIIALLTAASMGNAIIGLYIFLGGSGADHLLIGGRFFRAFGTFGQPNPFGGFMGLILPLALTAALASALQNWQIWRHTKTVHILHIVTTVYYGTASALMFAALVASWSRGAWLGFVASMGVVAFALPPKNWQRFMLVFGGGAFLAMMWFGGLVPQSIQNRVLSSAEDFFSVQDVRGIDITSENYAVAERIAHWQAAINMAQDYPWMGVGLGNYEVVYDEYRLMNWEEPLGHAHNYYLNVLGETGMIGFAIYCAFWIWILFITWRVRQHPDFFVQIIAAGMLGTWTYLLVHSIFDNLYVNNLFIHLGVLFGMLAMLYRQLQATVIGTGQHRITYVTSINKQAQ